jgi:hypothetical protein
MVRDPVESYKWINLAGSRVSGERQKTFARARDELIKHLSRAEIVEGQKRAREWQQAFERRQQNSTSAETRGSVGAHGLSPLSGRALLASGRRVFVRPVPEKDIHEVVGNLLREWGRWRVVDRPEDADIQVRLVLSGSAGWGRASIVATVEEMSSGAELWQSKKQTGNRTVFHRYTSPYNRAAEGIVEQMKVASGNWPRD